VSRRTPWSHRSSRTSAAPPRRCRTPHEHHQRWRYEPGRAPRASWALGAVLAATGGGGSCFPFPARWALSVAGARRCVPLARCALPGAMPAPRVLRCCAPAVLRPCQRGRGRVGRGSCKGVGGGGSVALSFARSEKGERSWVWGTRCAESGRRCRGGSRRSSRCQRRSPGAVVGLLRPISVCDTETLR